MIFVRLDSTKESPNQSDRIPTNQDLNRMECRAIRFIMCYCYNLLQLKIGQEAEAVVRHLTNDYVVATFPKNSHAIGYIPAKEVRKYCKSKYPYFH